jgi:hypothetical protein
MSKLREREREGGVIEAHATLKKALPYLFRDNLKK